MGEINDLPRIGLKMARYKANMSQRELCKHIYISRSKLAYIERGGCSCNTLTWFDLAKQLKIEHLEEIMEGFVYNDEKQVYIGNWTGIVISKDSVKSK